MKQIEIERIAKGLREKEYINNPHQAASDKAVLAGEYQFIAGQLEDVLQIKPSIWNEIRKGVKSDTAAERVWESTPRGIDESGLKLRAKAVEKMMSALTSLINLAQSEANNLM